MSVKVQECIPTITNGYVEVKSPVGSNDQETLRCSIVVSEEVSQWYM